MKKLLFSAVCLSLFQITSLYSQQRLIWSDEFNSKQLDETNWTMALGHGSQNDGWGNKELQNYTSDNISFKKGKLIITARKVGENKKRGDYTYDPYRACGGSAPKTICGIFSVRLCRGETPDAEHGSQNVPV